MGLFRRLFASTPKILDHPALGRMSWESRSGWSVNEVAPFDCRGKPSLSLAGDENGPSSACIATYERIRKDWNAIATKVAKEIFELNQNYFSDDPGQSMRSANQAWGSSELLAIDIYAEGHFSLSCVFDWQEPADGHTTTLYFENWVPAGSSVDG